MQTSALRRCEVEVQWCGQKRQEQKSRQQVHVRYVAGQEERAAQDESRSKSDRHAKMQHKYVAIHTGARTAHSPRAGACTHSVVATEENPPVTRAGRPYNLTCTCREPCVACTQPAHTTFLQRRPCGKARQGPQANSVALPLGPYSCSSSKSICSGRRGRASLHHRRSNNRLSSSVSGRLWFSERALRRHVPRRAPLNIRKHCDGLVFLAVRACRQPANAAAAC